MAGELKGSARQKWRWVGTIGAALVVIGALAWLFWAVSEWLAHRDVPALSGLTAQERLQALHQARDAARGRVLQLGTGLLATLALTFTGGNYVLNRKQNELNRQTLELTEQGQVTERYTKAVEQLGSETLEIRLGGIYALERISNDSPRDHSTVMEVIAAFIREHVQEPRGPRDGHAHTSQPEVDDDFSQSEMGQPGRRVRQDIRAAVAVIGRRGYQDQRVDLGDIDFSRAHLVGASLRGVDLTRAKFSSADLESANLEGSDLSEADMQGASLLGANLERAVLWGTRLNDANLFAATLMGADLYKAGLVDATLSMADLTAADLRAADASGAVFENARLVEVNLSRARLSHTVLERATLAGADLSEADLSGADLTDADLFGANLTAANVRGATFMRAHLTEALIDQDFPLPPGWDRDDQTGRAVRRKDTEG